MVDIEKRKKDNEIFSKYNKLVLDYFYNKTQNLELSKELSAETMSKIILNYDKNFNKITIDNWVFTITKNHFTDYIRKINAKSYINYSFHSDMEIYDQEIEMEPSDYNDEFNKLKEIILNCEDENLKKYFEYRYIYMSDTKSIMENLKFSYKKIKQYEDKLIKFFKEKSQETLFI